MHCTKPITHNLTWVGADDRRLAMFEGVYSVPKGVSYNSYLLHDEHTVLFDTVDKAVLPRFLENLAFALNGRGLDYLIVQHMEPDHSAAISILAERYPDMRIVCNAKTREFIGQFHSADLTPRIRTVAEGDTLTAGAHTLHFVMAPMVHWPEVMVTYDSTSKTLFSADAFGTFGAPGGALFADEVDFGRDYMDEARRYYANIVGKYGEQVQALLNKAATLDIRAICPLHGFVWRRNLNEIITKYALWSAYEPEERGVLIAYASVYGNTENAAEILACRLRERGVKTYMFDVSVTHPSEIVAAAFKYSHLVFASTTYNAGIFVTMEALINDLVSHNIQNRGVAVIENGSWAAASGGLIREKLTKCKDITYIDTTLSIKSSLKDNQLPQIDQIADALAAAIPKPPRATPLFNLSYGLFVLTAHEGGKDNGCVVNTVSQVTSDPVRISVTVNKNNHTHDMISRTGMFNASILAESAPFNVIKRFGFSSGRDGDKFTDCEYTDRAENGILYLTEHANGVLSAKVVQTLDCGTHTLFIAEVTQAVSLSDEPSLTYKYYFENTKPKPPKAPSKAKSKGFVCKICTFVYEGETLPTDYVCPICKHGAADFEPL